MFKIKSFLSGSVALAYAWSVAHVKSKLLISCKMIGSFCLRNLDIDDISGNR